jgi:Methyltransferase small domain
MMPMSTPRIHNTPPEAFGHRVRDEVTVSGRTFLFDRPAGLDHLFDHPAVRSAYASDEYIPYWADLWPAAVMLGEVVLAEPWADNLEALEFGCGLGISGMAALSRGLHVTFSDVDEAAVQLAASNARLNGFEQFETAAIDLRAAKFVKAALAPGGLALLTDTDRYSARPLRWLLDQEGLDVTTTPMKAGPPGNVQKGFLYRITHRG